MGLTGLMTTAGIGQGIEAILKRRLAEREMARLEAAQQADIERNRINDEAMRDQRQFQNQLALGQLGRQQQQDWFKAAETASEQTPAGSMVPEVVRGTPSAARIRAIPMTGMRVDTGGQAPPLEFMGMSASERKGEEDRAFRDQQAQLARDDRKDARAESFENQKTLVKLAASNRPQSVRTIKTTDANGRGVTRIVTLDGETVAEFPAAPTAEVANKSASMKRIGPVMAGISELSERINVGQGVMAKLKGAQERAEAKINLDDDVAEYESLISGFTPMVARAVGHTGMLTEQDVQSVRSLFPQPGDSKSLRDRKIKRIETVLGASGMTGEPDAAQRPPASAPPKNPPIGAVWNSPNGPVTWDGKMWKVG